MIPEIQRAMDIIFYHFGPLFALLPLTTWKIKILVKWKKVWIYHHFTQVYQKSWSYAIMLGRYDITCEICNFKFLFWVIFCPFTTVAAPKINLKKKKEKKNTWIYHHFTCVTKNMIIWCTVPEIWWVMDGIMDGKSDIYGCHS